MDAAHGRDEGKLVDPPWEALSTNDLFRLLWETGDGCIVRPAGESLLVVPEDPYPAAVTLRELLGGSESAAPASDAFGSISSVVDERRSSMISL